jgi:RNA polymerase sigma factor (sigma-70 family)
VAGEGLTDQLQLARVFLGYRKALARLVARIVKPHDIEDIVQETYIRIYQASQKRRIFHPKSFMLRTARNLALNHAARADALNYQVYVDEGDPANEALESIVGAGVVEAPDTLMQAEEEFLLFCRSVRDLSPQCRRAFILRKVYGLSQREVAKQLGISESTVEKHIARGITVAGAYLKMHGYSRPSPLASRDRRAAGASAEADHD